ncbi:MAG: cation diffusion facilitator family transporter [Candidatus Thiodiazotropha endolucinida]|nr:cation diffusion facilitator family transporter [Candidatus Thiodiazotropha endolucinida]
MHDHNHSHHDHDSGGRIGLAFALNLAFTVIEFIGGLLTNSTAIMADAVHDLGDTLSIGLGWWLNRLSGRKADLSFTYGYHRLSLLGALINGTVLVIGSIWVLDEAIPRLTDPQMPHAVGMTGLAILGVAVNGLAAYKLSGGKTLNERVLNWHLLEDVLGWLAVLIVGMILLFVDWPILDPILSIAFTLFILVNVAKNLSRTLHLFLQGTPDKQLTIEIRDKLLAIGHVANVHHLHLWSLDGERHVLTAHLLLDTPVSNAIHDAVKEDVRSVCNSYDFIHTTIELEHDLEACRDDICLRN